MYNLMYFNMPLWSRQEKHFILLQFTIRVLKISICRLLKKTQRRGARKIEEQRRTYPVRWSEAIERNEAYEAFSAVCYSCNLFSLSALLITDTELKVMATLAMMGLKRTPKNG